VDGIIAPKPFHVKSFFKKKENFLEMK
jgi:hypothetical protein